MSLDIKLESDTLIDCIVYDEDGIDEQANTISTSKDLNQNNEKYEDNSNDIDIRIIRPLDPDDVKFGEIFLSNKGAKLYFMCYFCSKSYYKIQDYVQHCVEDHNIDSWKIFHFLQNKKEIPEKSIKTKEKIKSKYLTLQEIINSHDHTYESSAAGNKIIKENMNLTCDKSNESIDIDNIENLDQQSHNLNDAVVVKFEDLSEEFECVECVDEEYLEEHSKQEKDVKKNKQSTEDSDDSTDFEDPSDLTKMKHCIHCLTKVINFKLHMRIKHFDLLYKCKTPYCYELFLTEKRLKEHVAVIHRDPEKPFACKNCEYKTNKKTSLDVHFKRIHLNIRNKKCSYCEKTFYDSGELKKHERVHTGERPAICYICGKGLRTTQDLNKHILRDHGEPTFGCKVCGKKFHLKETLLKHNFVHSNERPHICHVCGKAFKHVKYLREHMDLHSGTKKYECKTCGKKFAQKNNYTGHQKIHNKSKTEKKI